MGQIELVIGFLLLVVGGYVVVLSFFEGIVLMFKQNATIAVFSFIFGAPFFLLVSWIVGLVKRGSQSLFAIILLILGTGITADGYQRGQQASILEIPFSGPPFYNNDLRNLRLVEKNGTEVKVAVEYTLDSNYASDGYIMFNFLLNGRTVGGTLCGPSGQGFQIPVRAGNGVVTYCFAEPFLDGESNRIKHTDQVEVSLCKSTRCFTHTFGYSLDWP